MPGLKSLGIFQNWFKTIPKIMANTALPITGKSLSSITETTAIANVQSSPFLFSMNDDISSDPFSTKSLLV